MRQLIAALCVLMSTGLASDAVAQQWTEFSPVDARFRVEMPGTPDVHSNTITELGSLKLTQAVVEFGDGWFTASYVDVPPDQIKNANASSILDGARDTTIKWLVSRNDKSQLRSERRLITSGYPARDVVAEVPILDSVFVLAARFVFNGRQVIAITFTGPSGTETGADVSRFFNSLTLAWQ
jgi:hypothetical protein